MVKRTRQNRFCTEAYRIGLLTLLRHAHTGLLFISPPNRGDFYATSRTGLLWRSVNSSRIRYENRDAPMQSSTLTESEVKPEPFRFGHIVLFILMYT